MSLVALLDESSGFASYRKTRRALREGEKLWQADHPREGLSSALGFNLFESSMAAAITGVLVVFTNVSASKAGVHLDAVTPVTLQGRVASVLFGMLIPFVVIPHSLIAAWASLKKPDITRHRIAESARAYLYFDGMHGLLGQALFAYGLATAHYNSAGLEPYGAWSSAAIILGGILFVRVQFAVIPGTLHTINGYTGKPSRVAYFFGVWWLGGWSFTIMLHLINALSSVIAGVISG